MCKSFPLRRDGSQQSHRTRICVVRQRQSSELARCRKHSGRAADRRRFWLSAGGGRLSVQSAVQHAWSRSSCRAPQSRSAHRWIRLRAGCLVCGRVRGRSRAALPARRKPLLRFASLGSLPCENRGFKGDPMTTPVYKAFMMVGIVTVVAVGLSASLATGQNIEKKLTLTATGLTDGPYGLTGQKGRVAIG